MVRRRSGANSSPKLGRRSVPARFRSAHTRLSGTNGISTRISAPGISPVSRVNRQATLSGLCPAGNVRAGSDPGWRAAPTIRLYTSVTRMPPSDAHASVQPIASSRVRRSSKSSASHVTAATISTHTPMNVVHRNSTSCHSSVLYAAATGENE